MELIRAIYLTMGFSIVSGFMATMCYLLVREMIEDYRNQSK